MALRIIFGPKKGEGGRRLEKTHKLYASAMLIIIIIIIIIIIVIKSRSMRWAGHVTYMEDEKFVQNFGRKN